MLLNILSFKKIALILSSLLVTNPFKNMMLIRDFHLSSSRTLFNFKMLSILGRDRSNSGLLSHGVHFSKISKHISDLRFILSFKAASTVLLIRLYPHSICWDSLIRVGHAHWIEAFFLRFILRNPNLKQITRCQVAHSIHIMIMMVLIAHAITFTFSIWILQLKLLISIFKIIEISIIIPWLNYHNIFVVVVLFEVYRWYFRVYWWIGVKLWGLTRK